MTGASIILPVSKNLLCNHIKAAILSVAAQTYFLVELIIVNDGCAEIDDWLPKFCESIDLQIKIVTTNTRGLGNAINTGVASSSHPIIIRMDGDDEMLPNRVALQMAFFSKHLAQHVILGGNAIAINGAGDVIGDYTKVRHKRPNKLISYFGSPFIHPTIAFRRETFDLIGGYANIGPSQDFEFISSARKRDVTLENLSEHILRYRVLSNSESRQFDYRKIVNGYLVRSSQWIRDPVKFRKKVVLAAEQRKLEKPGFLVARLVLAKYRNEDKRPLFIFCSFMLALLKKEYAADFISNITIRIITRIAKIYPQHYVS